VDRRTNGGEPAEAGSKSARTRERLLDAAAGVLSRKGFAGTRLSDIAEQAHVQAPAIYYYYSSREDLIEEVMFVGASAMRTHLRDTLAAMPDASAVRRVEAAVEAHLRHELEISEYATAIIRNGNQLPPKVSKRALEEIAAYNDIWRGLIAELDRAGELRADIEPAAGRMLVLGALNWAAEWWSPERGPLEDTIRTAQSMVLHALRP
jgi:TetR/AcrR family transcriptional regulator, cholesterol catabolism regulator